MVQCSEYVVSVNYVERECSSYMMGWVLVVCARLVRFSANLVVHSAVTKCSVQLSCSEYAAGVEVVHSAVVDRPEIKECMPYPVLSGLGLLCHACVLQNILHHKLWLCADLCINFNSTTCHQII